MNFFKKLIWITPVILLGIFLMSADHIDAPSVASTSADITDYYAFQNPAEDALVFVVNTQGLIAPAETGNATFDEDVLIEINIDEDADNIQDLVIQAVVRDNELYVFGPFAPSTTGASSSINDDATNQVKVEVSEYGMQAVTAENAGLKAFAGPRDDPFFFDLGAYQAILSGNATGFSDPGTDTFAGTNVMSIVVEVPKSLLGNADSVNTWVTSKVRG